MIYYLCQDKTRVPPDTLRDCKSAQEIEDNPATSMGAVIMKGKTHKKEEEVFNINGV